MESQGAKPPAGFYDDGSGRQRWWDGAGWTEHRQGAPQPPATSNEGMGWMATIGYILAILAPFLGFLVGLALVVRRDKHAAGVIALSILISLIFFLVVVG